MLIKHKMFTVKTPIISCSIKSPLGKSNQTKMYLIWRTKSAMIHHKELDFSLKHRLEERVYLLSSTGPMLKDIQCKVTFVERHSSFLMGMMPVSWGKSSIKTNFKIEGKTCRPSLRHKFLDKVLKALCLMSQRCFQMIRVLLSKKDWASSYVQNCSHCH